jgi:hypothetical protein
VQKIVEASGTLYFKFGDLDATKPAGGIKIRVQTIVHYLEKYSPEIIRRKLAWLPAPCPLYKSSPNPTSGARLRGHDVLVFDFSSFPQQRESRAAERRRFRDGF